jgi:hypothetical protein
MPTMVLLNMRVFWDTTLSRLYIVTDVSEGLSPYRVSSIIIIIIIIIGSTALGGPWPS